MTTLRPLLLPLCSCRILPNSPVRLTSGNVQVLYGVLNPYPALKPRLKPYLQALPYNPSKNFCVSTQGRQ